jgi:acetyl-CoA C-acetyltransferase
MAASEVYVLGGDQTDFARNYTRDNKDIAALMADAVEGALAACEIEPGEVETAHIANFGAELFCGQGQLGGLFAALDPAFSGRPTSRHEAACTSGSVAILSAAAEIEAGRYDLAAVVGVELMRNVPAKAAAEHLGAAAWHGREFTDTSFVWPRAFSALTEVYDERYGIDYRHLGRIAEINYANGRRNPKAQTRSWTFGPNSFSEDDAANPVVEGRVRRNDCGQLTDGAAAVFLASRAFAEAYAARRGIGLADIPRIRGWGHRTATMLFADKVRESVGRDPVLPHVQGTIADAFRRAGIDDVFALDLIETHDCFAMTEYMAIDHFGITAPGESWKAVEDGTIDRGGRLPINPSGGLIGLGHPVGATGVRMMLDACNQVAGRAGDCQVEGARTAGILNIGGSATTTCCFVVGRDAA